MAGAAKRTTARNASGKHSAPTQHNNSETGMATVPGSLSRGATVVTSIRISVALRKAADKVARKHFKGNRSAYIEALIRNDIELQPTYRSIPVAK